MDENEKYVRERWELVHRCDGSYRHYVRGTVLVQDTHGHWLDFESWDFAYAFTIERERQIAEREQDCCILNRIGNECQRSQFLH